MLGPLGSALSARPSRLGPLGSALSARPSRLGPLGYSLVFLIGLLCFFLVTPASAQATLTTVATSSNITLNWSSSRIVDRRYNVYRGPQSGGPYTRIASNISTEPAGSSGTLNRMYLDSTGLTAGVKYYYKVYVLYNNGTTDVERESSNEASAALAAPSPDFQLTAYPARLAVIQGLSSGLTVSVVPSNGFNGSVALTNSALPSGVTLVYGTDPTTGASVLTFTATPTATLGQGSVTIAGTSGSLTQTVTIPLTVAPVVTGASGNVTLAFGTGEVGLTAGSTAGGGASLTITPVNGYTGPVSFVATGLPSGVSVVTNPTAISLTGTAAQTTLVTFQATSAVTPGYYPVAITGTGNGGVTTTAVTGLNILPPPNALPFLLTVTDNSTNAIPTGIASAVVALGTTSGYSQPITLSLVDDPTAPVLAPANTTDPTKIGVSFSQASLAVSGTSALTVTIGASVAPGAYHFVVKGTSADGSIQRAAFTVFVLPENLATGPNIEGRSTGQTYTGDNPPYPLAAGIGDMERFDLDPSSSFEIGSSGHIAPSISAPGVLHPNAPTGLAGLPDGTDDRKYVAATIAPPYVYAYRACIRVTAIFPDKTALHGSGTLIGMNHVLTAAHVVFDPSRGGTATTILVFPGFDYNWSLTHLTTFTTSNHTFVAKGYLKGATFASGAIGNIFYDDWAVIDCNPITNGPVGQRGRPLGSYTQYMQLESTDTVYPPSVVTHIAGYPGFTWAPATPILTGTRPGICPDLFESYTYNGDDGPVNASPDPNLLSDSPSLLFPTMDATIGESGAGLWHFGSDDPTDTNYNVYGVYDAIFTWSGLGSRSGVSGVANKITTPRRAIR